MVNATPDLIVDGPARVPAPYGLFSVLQFREPLNRGWEASGLKWQSFDASLGLGVIGPVQVDPDDITGLPKDFGDRGIIDHAGVFTVYGQDLGTPVVRNQTVRTERARTILTTLEERQVERVLWGTDGDIPEPLNEDAAGVGTVAAGPDGGFVEVIAKLEKYLGDVYGSRGVIHLSRSNAVYGIAQKALETRGNALFTRVGTPVVAGTGYGDNAAYATSALLAYRSDVFDNVARPYDLLDRGNNNLYAIAERTYLVGFESEVHGVVTLTAD